MEQRDNTIHTRAQAARDGAAHLHRTVRQRSGGRRQTRRADAPAGVAGNTAWQRRHQRPHQLHRPRAGCQDGACAAPPPAVERDRPPAEDAALGHQPGDLWPDHRMVPQLDVLPRRSRRCHRGGDVPQEGDMRLSAGRAGWLLAGVHRLCSHKQIGRPDAALPLPADNDMDTAARVESDDLPPRRLPPGGHHLLPHVTRRQGFRKSAADTGRAAIRLLAGALLRRALPLALPGDGMFHGHTHDHIVLTIGNSRTY